MNIQIFGKNKCFDPRKHSAISRNGALNFSLWIFLKRDLARGSLTAFVRR